MKKNGMVKYLIKSYYNKDVNDMIEKDLKCPY